MFVQRNPWLSNDLNAAYVVDGPDVFRLLQEKNIVLDRIKGRNNSAKFCSSTKETDLISDNY